MIQWPTAGPWPNWMTVAPSSISSCTGMNSPPAWNLPIVDDFRVRMQCLLVIVGRLGIQVEVQGSRIYPSSGHSVKICQTSCRCLSLPVLCSGMNSPPAWNLWASGLQGRIRGQGYEAPKVDSLKPRKYIHLGLVGCSVNRISQTTSRYLPLPFL